jgi:Tfp pilus assembly protein PilP
MRGLTILLSLGLTAAACTQAAPPPARPAKAAPVAAKKPAPVKAAAVEQVSTQTASNEPYAYQSDGRRDPFVNALNSGSVDPRTPGQRPEGLAGVAVNEIAIRGLVLINGARVAMVQGPDGRNYNVHQGDKLLDGVVKSIVPEGLVIVQDVNDPLSTAKQREVRKLLRSLEEAKQ